MKADRRTAKRCARLRDAGGYSLVEILIAIGASVVVGLGIYATFNYSQKSSLSNRIYSDLQTGCNFAMDQMKSELMLAGYRARDQVRPISAAGANAVTFEYWDDNARDEGPFATGYNNNTQVTYRLLAGDLLREMKRYKTGAGAGYDPANVITQKLASNVAELSFGYLGSDNAAWNAGDDEKDIRTIRPTLTCDAGRLDPNTKQRPRIKLVAEVRARNVGVASTATDTQPPLTPSDLKAWDPGECGKIELSWRANNEADLEGYTIVYGLATGAYSDRIVITRPPRAANVREYYTLTGLTSNRIGPPAVPARYFVAVQAFDKSGNLSVGFSPEASGNPTTSTRSEAAVAGNGSDTGIDPTPPTAPTAFSAIATPATDNSVSLSWTPPAVSGLAGYRLYRSTTAAFVPNDTPVTGNRIASEVQLSAAATSFVDTGAEVTDGKLTGCTTYYYKISPIVCDRALAASYTAAQFASASAAPTDGTPPPDPIITARPGYRRIILTLTNPVGDKGFDRTTIHWSKGTYPTVATAVGAISPSPKIPRSGGTFTAEGTLPTINFNDETSATATAPNLAPDTTYYFLAVAYDQCGNHTGVSDASIAEGTQCGDCLLPAPAPPGSPDPACYGAPSGQQPTGVDPEGCFESLDLAWNPIDDVVIRDFQGFRIFRREGPDWTGGTNEVNLTGDDAAWLTVFKDASVEEGKRYSYRIMATDCYYEQHHGKPPGLWPEPGNDPNDNFREAFIYDVAVGRPLFDSTRPEVLTGSLLASPPVFHHTPVTFWMRNASDARLTLTTLESRWENPDTWLQRVVVGDGSTTPVTVAFDDAANPLTNGAAGSSISFAPGTRLDALDGQIPFQSTFLSSGRGLDSTTDMRSEQIDFTLRYRNDSTGTEGCNVTGRVFTPLGPYIYAMSQNKPYFGTAGWPVPGTTGINSPNAVKVPGGADVTVYAEVLDASAAGIAAGSVRLYYLVDATKSVAVAPAVTGTYPTLNYTALTMTYVAGDQWRATIPAVTDSNVWYFVVAQDAQGNFDRDPEPWGGAYQYQQLPPDNCSSLPNPPVIAGSTSGGNVTLTWTLPTMNATPAGLAYTDPGGFKVYRNRNDGSGWVLHSAGTITNPLTTTWTDSAVYLLDTYAYQYYVTAYDACQPTPNESAASNLFSELVEGVCGNTPSAPVISGAAASMPDNVVLTWVAPTTNEPPATGPLVDLGGYQVWRKTLAGPWTQIGTVGAAATTYTDTTATSIKTEVYSYYLKSFDICATPAPKVSQPSNIYQEAIVFNPCDETPNPATLSGSAGAGGVDLTWAPPASNTNGEDFRDGGGYEVWRSQNAGAATLIATVNSSTYTYSDTSVAGDLGTAVYRYHVVVFDTCGTPNRSGASNVYTENYSSPCGTTPNPPVLGGASAASGVTLSWTAPALNTDGSLFGDPGGYRVYRRKTTTGTWASIATTTAGTFSYPDTSVTSDLGTVEYFYHVTAIDTCSPTANESAPSGTYAESYTDPCASLATPSVPLWSTSPVGAVASSCTANGGKVTLTWRAPTTVPDGYRVYGCTCAGTTPPCVCTPATKLNVTDPQTALSFQHTPGGKLNAVRWRYGIKSVNKGTCSDTARWKESPLSTVEWDRCTPQ